MTAPTGNVPARIFMSYRHEETGYPAAWLYDLLVGRFGRSQVFKDIDSIVLGDDFVEAINTAVGSCDVLLALIGARWLTITGKDGRRRLDDPGDFVRLEIEAALARNVRVIPVLFDGASMPRADELPAGLAALARRQALELSPSRFDADSQRLLTVLDGTIADTRASPPSRPSSRTPARKAPASSLRSRSLVAAPVLHEMTDDMLTIQSMSFSRDGRLLATAGADGIVRLWDPVTGRHLRNLEADGDESDAYYFDFMALSPDGRLLAVGNFYIQLWDLVNSRHLHTFRGSNIDAMAFDSAGNLLTASYDNKVFLWDTTSGGKREVRLATPGGFSGKMKARIKKEHVVAAAFSPEGRRLAMGTDEDLVYVWNPVSGQHLQTLKGHKSSVHAVAFSPDGELIASSSVDETMRLWRSVSGEQVRKFDGNTRYVNFITFSPDGRVLATGGHWDSVRLWDPGTGKTLRTFQSESDDRRARATSCVAFSPDGGQLAVGETDEELERWFSFHAEDNSEPAPAGNLARVRLWG